MILPQGTGNVVGETSVRVYHHGSLTFLKCDTVVSFDENVIFFFLVCFLFLLNHEIQAERSQTLIFFTEILLPASATSKDIKH